MKNNKNLIIILIICNLISFIWCTIWTSLNKEMYLLFVVYLSELFSTITFQLRIYWTAKNKFYYAATIGAISWISGLSGIMISFVSGLLLKPNAQPEDLVIAQLIWFALTMIPIGMATFQGIAILNWNKKQNKGKNNE